MPSHKTATSLLLLTVTTRIVDAYIPAAPEKKSVSNPFETLLKPKVGSGLTRVGSLSVPKVGCGTLAWSVDNGKIIKVPSNFGDVHALL